MKITDFTYFYPENPSLILSDKLVDTLSEDADWIAERKYNETRLELHYIDGEFQFWNRHEKRLDYQPDAELQKALDELASHLHGYCLFDGGLRHNKVTGVRHKIMLYDVFIWNNVLLNDKPYWFKRNVFKIKLGLVCEGEPIGIPTQYNNGFRQLFDRLVAKNDDEIEGLVLKNTRKPFRLGRQSARQSTWMLKLRKETGRHRW